MSCDHPVEQLPPRGSACDNFLVFAARHLPASSHPPRRASRLFAALQQFGCRFAKYLVSLYNLKLYNDRHAVANRRAWLGRCSETIEFDDAHLLLAIAYLRLSRLDCQDVGKMRISPAISLQPSRWDIPFEILQFSNATPSISCKRACAGELAVDNMSAMPAVSKIDQTPAGSQRTGRPLTR